MVLLFVLGVLLFMVAVALLAMGLRPEAGGRGLNRSLAVLEAMTDAPRELTADLEKPFADRVLQPLQDRALKIGRRVSGADSAERIRRKLDLAGNPVGWTVDRFTASKVLGAGVGFLIAIAIGMLVADALTTRLIIAVAGLAVGFLGRSLYLYQLAYERTNRLRTDLPDAIDLMTISVESGLGFDAAVLQVAHNTEGPLADEFSRMIREMQLGMGRAEALRSLADRTDLDDLRSFVSSMVQ